MIVLIHQKSQDEMVCSVHVLYTAASQVHGLYVRLILSFWLMVTNSAAKITLL